MLSIVVFYTEDTNSDRVGVSTLSSLRKVSRAGWLVVRLSEA